MGVPKDSNKRCIATTQTGPNKGKRCKNPRLKGREYCFFHDPSEDTKLARKDGRCKSRATIMLSYPEDGITTEIGSRGILAEQANLYQQASEATDPDERSRLRLMLDITKELRWTVKQVREEEGTMPPQRVVVESELTDAGKKLSLVQIAAMRAALRAASQEPVDIEGRAQDADGE